MNLEGLLRARLALLWVLTNKFSVRTSSPETMRTIRDIDSLSARIQTILDLAKSVGTDSITNRQLDGFISGYFSPLDLETVAVCLDMQDELPRAVEEFPSNSAIDDLYALQHWLAELFGYPA